MAETPLSTYDPDWQKRWDAAQAVLTARNSRETQAQSPRTREDTEQRAVALDAKHAAHHAQFMTVEEYRDHILEWELRIGRGCDVPPPHFPEGASLGEVRALMDRFREEVRTAKHLQASPAPSDPPGLVAFTTPQRPGSQRSVEDVVVPMPWGYRPVECRMAMEVTTRDLHVCFMSVPQGVALTNRIEELATVMYRERFAPTRVLDRVLAALGIWRAGCYPRRSVTFYEYYPWTFAALGGAPEKLSVLRIRSEASEGLTDADRTAFSSIPPYLSELAKAPSRLAQASRVTPPGEMAGASAS